MAVRPPRAGGLVARSTTCARWDNGHQGNSRRSAPVVGCRKWKPQAGGRQWQARWSCGHEPCFADTSQRKSPPTECFGWQRRIIGCACRGRLHCRTTENLIQLSGAFAGLAPANSHLSRCGNACGKTMLMWSRNWISSLACRLPVTSPNSGTKPAKGRLPRHDELQGHRSFLAGNLAAVVMRRCPRPRRGWC